MLVTWRTLNGRHLATAQCDKGAERKRIKLVEEELWESLERAFQADEKPLKTVTLFKYMGWFMPAGDSNWPEVAEKLRNSLKSLTWMKRILGREEKYPRIYSLFFKVVVQAVLLFGLEKWALIPRMKHALGSF